MEMGHVVLWENNMSSCWRRIYGVFFLEKNICCLVGEEYMVMEDVFLVEKNILLFLFLFLFLSCSCACLVVSVALNFFCVPSGLPQAPFFVKKDIF